MADKDTAIVLEVNGEQIHIDVSDIDGVEWRDIRNVSGLRPNQLFAAMQDLDFEAFAAVLWVVRRRDQSDLKYDDVLASLTLASFNSEGGEDPDPDDAVS